MAKLSAHGNELARVEKDLQLTEVVCTTTHALMADGAILQKDMFRRTDGSKHGSGWKLLQKSGALRASNPQGWVAQRTANGWRRA